MVYIIRGYYDKQLNSDTGIVNEVYDVKDVRAGVQAYAAANKLKSDDIVDAVATAFALAEHIADIVTFNFVVTGHHVSTSTTKHIKEMLGKS